FHLLPPSPPLSSFPTRRTSDFGLRIDLQEDQKTLIRVIAEVASGHTATTKRGMGELRKAKGAVEILGRHAGRHDVLGAALGVLGDRKSTRLNSSHVKSSYAVFC